MAAGARWRAVRTVSPNPSNSYAPALFATEDDAEGVTKAAFKSAMGRVWCPNAAPR
jgi:hypothetical protein